LLSLEEPRERLAPCPRPFLAHRSGTGEPARHPDVLSRRPPPAPGSHPSVDRRSAGTGEADRPLRPRRHGPRLGARVPLGHHAQGPGLDPAGVLNVDEGPTPSQTVGPFFGFALPFEADAETVGTGTPGALSLAGRLLDGQGDAVPDGLLEVWQGDQFARC